MADPIPAPTTTSPWAPITTLAEKAFWTGAEAFLAAFILAGTLDTSTQMKAGIAGLAALVTVLANGVMQIAVPGGVNPFVDVVLRAVRTFVAGFLAPLVVPLTGGTIPGLDGFKAAGFAGVLAALAVVKGFVASRLLPGTATPATLPASLDLAA